MEAQDRRVPTLFIIPLILFLVGSLLFIALLHGQKDLTILAFLILSVASGAKVWSRMSLLKVKCYSMVDKLKVFPGEKLTLEVNAENAKFLPIWLRMRVPVDGPLHPSSGEETFEKDSGLLWYQKVRFQWDLIAHRRGVYRIGPPHLKVGDLLGFFPREKDAHDVIHVIVYPRLVPVKPFSLPRRDFFGIPGARSPVQDPIYILGTRDYQPWQPARYINWKASARHSRLQEKVFESTEQEKALFVVEVDQFANNKAEEEFEHTLEIVASLATRFERRGCAVGLATNGLVFGGGPGIVPVARNPHQLSVILEVLARLKMEPGGKLLDKLQRGMGPARGLSCVHFSYEEDVATVAAESYFKRRKTPVVFFVCRPRAASGEDGYRAGRKMHTLDEIHPLKGLGGNEG